MWVFMLMAGWLIVVILVVIVTSSNSASRAMEQAFEGEVIGCRVEQHTLTTGMRTDYWLDVRTDDGEVIAVSVSGQICAKFKAGDRIVKRVGDRWPST